MIKTQSPAHQALPVGILMTFVSIASACPPAPFFSGVGFLPGGTSAGEPFDRSQAFAVSADGLTVVGGSNSANATEGCLSWYSEAFSWREDTGIVALGDLPDECFESRAFGTSSDGNLVVGTGTPGPIFKEAFSWTQPTGMVGLSDLGLSWIDSAAHGISDDGSIIFGNCQPSTQYRACTWTSGTGWVVVGGLGLQTYSEGSAISNNGTWVTGWWDSSADFRRRPFRRSSSTGTVTPGGVSGTNYGYGIDVSDNGTVVGYTDNVDQGFEWTAAGAFVILGNGTPGAIAPDATLIGGRYYDATVKTLYQAAIWDVSRTRHRAVDVLAENGVAVPCGWILSGVTDIVVTCGVVTMTGSGMNPNGETEGWIARYVPGSTAVNGCDDGDACTVNDTCSGGQCVGTHECRLYGDVVGAYCVIDVDDLLCVLDGFTGLTPCDTVADIFPCGGNAVIDVDDILAELNAFSGNFACPHPCP